jgi:hypothetical protein
MPDREKTKSRRANPAAFHSNSGEAGKFDYAI